MANHQLLFILISSHHFAREHSDAHQYTIYNQRFILEKLYRYFVDMGILLALEEANIILLGLMNLRNSQSSAEELKSYLPHGDTVCISSLLFPT